MKRLISGYTVHIYAHLPPILEHLFHIFTNIHIKIKVAYQYKIDTKGLSHELECFLDISGRVDGR